MVDSMKHPPTDLKGLFTLARRKRRTRAFAYGFMITFIVCTAYITYSPSFGTTPWVNTFVTSTYSYRSRLNSFIVSASNSTASYRSQFSSFISSIFSNSNSTLPDHGVGGVGSTPSSDLGTGSVGGSPKVSVFVKNLTSLGVGFSKGSSLSRNSTGSGGGLVDGSILGKNMTSSGAGSAKASVLGRNSTSSVGGSLKGPILGKNLTGSSVGAPKASILGGNSTSSGVGSLRVSTLMNNLTGFGGSSQGFNGTKSGNVTKGVGVLVKDRNSSSVGSVNGILVKNQTIVTGGPASNLKTSPPQSASNGSLTGVVVPKKPPAGNQTRAGGAPPTPKAKSGSDPLFVPAVPLRKPTPSPKAANGQKWNIESMRKCNLFHGKWVKDESYPLYPPGSCPHIDESFDCFLNGRPELSYQKLRWQPHGCYIPRLNATDMLERLRGKRLVFVGDSLNRNMWEALVCVLMNSIKDKSKVFEASGRHEFKTDGSYSFVFKDYNCTVEFFRSVFLVQEWEMHDNSGKEKETLRLDMIAKSSSGYKDADFIVFNTGHWWTHDKTAKGKDYYQEGNHIYNQLNVVDAFHKALNTWARWVDANVNPRKSVVFFRGYSSSHYRGGQWNSGGQCDVETEPIKNEKYLAPYPPKMDVLESVLNGMKTPVIYLNITRMTDYRKDAHPSVYRKPNLTEDERRGPNRYQDCSHWCLPGVPDSWNELLYAQLLIRQHEL